MVLIDFNAGVEKKPMKCNNIKSLIKQLACYLNPDSLTCNNLLLSKVP